MQLTVFNMSVADVTVQPPDFNNKLAKNDFVRPASNSFLEEIASPNANDIVSFKASRNFEAEDEYTADCRRYRFRSHLSCHGW